MMLFSVLLCFSCYIASLFFISDGMSVVVTTEYCQWETFNASCPVGWVILMQTALYGRMRHGRCADTDVYIGCSTEVTSEMDTRCSGRRECTVAIPDSVMHKQQPCPSDMMAYLEASYVCIRDSAHGNCQSSIHSNDQEGYLASQTSRITGRGSQDCPWIISVHRGQHIDLHVIDLSLNLRYKSEPYHRAPSELEYCHMYATVTDGDIEFSVCASHRRDSLVYTSKTSTITVELAHQLLKDENIVIRYVAIGCPDLEVDVDTLVHRTRDKVTVSCRLTSQVWHLVCKETQWIGQIGHCKKGDIKKLEKITATEQTTLPTYGLLIAIIIGVIVGALCGFGLLAAILLCKRLGLGRDGQPRSRPKMAADVELAAPPVEQQEVDSLKFHHFRLPQESSEFTYAHIWELTHQPRPTSEHDVCFHFDNARNETFNQTDIEYLPSECVYRSPKEDATLLLPEWIATTTDQVSSTSTDRNSACRILPTETISSRESDVKVI